MERVYFDYAASTPVDPRVAKSMAPYFGAIFGNPHALHRFGQEGSAAVFEARRTIAKALGADYRELIFTGSATEANNLALRGLVRGVKRPRIVTTVIEHESVLETCRDLEKDGVEVIYVPVDRDGIVDPRKIRAALNDRTVLVSVMHANNEVGTIQPIREIAEIVKAARTAGSPYPLLHTDAVQSFQYLDCNAGTLGADLITLSAHKIYGPKGIGALYVRNLPDLQNVVHPVITGSGQEFGFRSGTDNVPYIVGFAKAVEIAMRVRAKESARVGALRDRFWKKLQAASPKLQLNGSRERRLPNNLNIYFPGHDAQELLIELDMKGIAVSPGAACRSAVAKASYVVAEMGFPMARAEGSLRFTFGRPTTAQEVDRATKIIAGVL